MSKKTFVVNIYNGRILEQAKASKALVKLSQKLADFNEGWVPDWGECNSKNWCIDSNFVDGSHVFDVDCYWRLPRFLAFKTEEDAEKFLDENIDEIYLARDFV